MKYYYKEEELDIAGNECPTCGKKSWNIFQCENCGKVFCASCNSELIQIDNETRAIDVTCECGSNALFIDI